MAQGGSYLDKLLLGIKTVEWNGAEMPFRSVINFLGGTVSDNPGNGSTDVTLGGSSSGSGGYTTIQVSGNPEPSRIAINFIGLDVSDDVTHNRTNVTLDYGNPNATGVLTAPFGGTGVTSLANHGVVLGGGVGPLTTVPSSTDGYVLTLASGIPTWSPSTGGGGATFDSFGDVNFVAVGSSTEGNVRSISGPNGPGDPAFVQIPVDVDTFNWATSRMPVLSQDPTGELRAQPFVIAPQWSTNPNGTPGHLIVQLGVQNGSGTAPLFELAYGTTGYIQAALGQNTGAGPCLWLLDPLGGSGPPNGSNYTLLRFGPSLYLNTPDGVGGSFYFTGTLASKPTAFSISVTNTTAFTGATLVSDGAGWIGVSTVTSAPTATSDGGVWYVKSDNNLYFRSSLGEFQLTPSNSFTAGGDLGGTNTSQQVEAFTGSAGVYVLRRSTTQMALQFPDGTGSGSFPDFIDYPVKTADTGAYSLTLKAQDAWTSAATNTKGGSLLIEGGAGTSGAPAASVQFVGSDSASTTNSGQIGIVTGFSGGAKASLIIDAGGIMGSPDPIYYSNTQVSLTGLGGTTITLTSAQYAHPTIDLQGTAGAGQTTTILFPNVPGRWEVIFDQLVFGAGAVVILQSGSATTGNITSATITLSSTVGILNTFGTGGGRLAFTI